MSQLEKRHLLRRFVVLCFLVTVFLLFRLSNPPAALAAPLCSECAADYPWPAGYCPPESEIGHAAHYACVGCFRSCITDYDPGDPSDNSCGNFSAEFQGSDSNCYGIDYYGTDNPSVCNPGDYNQCGGGRGCGSGGTDFLCLCPNGTDPEHYDSFSNSFVKDPC